MQRTRTPSPGAEHAGDPDLRLLQAVADPARLAILRQLSAEGPTCACEFSDCCDISQSTVSHHLKVLREAGWISGERRGTWIWYSIRKEAADRFEAIASGIRPGGARPAVSLGRGPRDTSDEVPSLRVMRPSWREW